ncbi:MAG: MBL fold metallo-hydrolase [Syntrophales bacterium]|nr:MBL fold metallo-hydrolase [Syntrophales bacterium]
MKDRINWLGHATIRIDGDKTIYIDPWKTAGTPPAEVILVSHSHYDHYSPKDIESLTKADTGVVTPPDPAIRIKGEHRTLKPGERISVYGLDIEATPAYNPKKAFHPHQNAWIGFLLTVEGTRIYYAGDTDLIPEMEDIRADIVIVPVGGTYTMNAEEAARLVNKIVPALAIPIHFGDIVGSLEDALRFRDLAKVPVEIKQPCR